MTSRPPLRDESGGCATLPEKNRRRVGVTCYASRSPFAFLPHGSRGDVAASATWGDCRHSWYPWLLHNSTASGIGAAKFSCLRTCQVDDEDRFISPQPGWSTRSPDATQVHSRSSPACGGGALAGRRERWGPPATPAGWSSYRNSCLREPTAGAEPTANGQRPMANG